MSVEFDLQLTTDIQRSILDFLSTESKDYFFFSDFLTQRVYFSKNFMERFNLLGADTENCSIESCRYIVYPKDLPALHECYQLLKNGQKHDYHLDFRLIDRTDSVVWINCHIKVTPDSNGRALWMFGRLSATALADSGDQPAGASGMEGLKKELNALLADGTDGFLLLVGMDNLKSINLKNGREFGDQLLRKLADALESAAQGTRKIYRTVGDCFAITLPGMDAAGVKNVFDTAQLQMAGQCTISGGSVPLLEYSIPDAETLYQYAESSLDRAKQHGKKTLMFFSSEDYEQRIAALELKEDLENSIDNDFLGFSLCYQPQVYSHSYQLYGAEALLRYTSPRRGPVSPTEFVPLLEQNHKICPVGIWALDTALAQCAKFREFLPDFHMSVNMSYTQLCQSNILSDVLLSLKRSGLPGSALTIEITESIQLTDYPHINDIFLEWKKYGIEISVDDFGTGYSSLGRLKELEIDEIKIDRSFVSNIQSSAYNYRLISNMIELADSCQIRVCCEGVETQAELSALEELRPTLLQGFLFSKPCTPEEFTDLYLDQDSSAFKERLQREASYRSPVRTSVPAPCQCWDESSLACAVMNAENDVFYISDLDTYELYYLNRAGQRLTNVRDYRGQKCYKVLQGLDSPCPFCTNALLSQNNFHIWERYNEYYGRHFLLKDKLITYQGKSVRLEVALDITKHEIISKNTQERLNFAQKIETYIRALSGNSCYSAAVNTVLAAVGEFYQADRAYLFEPSLRYPDTWSNSYEWCAANVVPQKANLQQVSARVLSRWMDEFQKDHTIYIYNLDVLKRENYAEWEVLNSQGISRLMAVPVWERQRIIGFIGVDNPRYSIHDDSQIRVLTYFLVSRIHQDRNELRYQELFQTDYHDIFDTLDLGLWVIHIYPEANRYEMLANDTMLRVLGISGVPSPEECYQFWYSRINDGYYYYVNHSLESMIQTRKTIQLEYTWTHPERGEVLIRCTGIRAEDQNGAICLKGYHRIVDDLEQPTCIPDICARDVLEYNELHKTIFFHTDRTLVAGDSIHEANFPQAWIDNEIVHPHFALEFKTVLSRLRLTKKPDRLELLLKSKNGTYQWFHATFQHLNPDDQNSGIIIIILEPAAIEQVMELEYMRMRRFYQVLLSETIAYAEVDLSDGQLKSVGGLWRIHEHECKTGARRFLDILIQNLTEFLPDADLSLLKEAQTQKIQKQLFRRGNMSQRFCYRRPVSNENHWVELTVYFFHEELTMNCSALIYLKDANVEKEQVLAAAEEEQHPLLANICTHASFERQITQTFEENHTAHGVLLLLDVASLEDSDLTRSRLEADRMLRQVGGILTTAFRRDDIIGRLSSSRFLVYMKGNFPRARLAERLKSILSQFASLSAHPLTANIGLTYIDTDHFDYAGYLRQAELALNRSKMMGKNLYCFHDSLSQESSKSTQAIDKKSGRS